MKLISCIIFISLSFCAGSQVDSLKNFRFSALSVEIQFPGRGQSPDNTTNASFQKVVKNDALLNRTAGQLTSNGYGFRSGSSFRVVFSAKGFFDMKPLKRFNRQAYIGLSAGRVQQLSLSYLNTVYDTTAFMFGPSYYYITVDDYQSAYSYEINALKLLVPLGLNFITNKNKLFWFSAGLELCPGISTFNVYIARYQKTKTELALNAYSSYNNIRSYARSNTTDVVESDYTKKRMGSAGFTGSVSLPLSMNFNIPKKVLYSNQLGIFVTLAPGYYITANKYTGTNVFFFVNASAGIRYTL